MKKMAFACIMLLCGNAVAYPQNTITGTFPALSGQQVKLAGFKGFDTYSIGNVKVDEKGGFNLSYTENDFGMAYLAAEDKIPFIVILASDENLILQGESLALPETVSILSGRQNQLFGQYAYEHPLREQALSAWDFLAKIYLSDSLFSVHQQSRNSIQAEIRRIKEEDDVFLASLSPDSYLSWYLPVRKLVSSVQSIAQYRTDEIPGAIAAFRNIDYTDPRLYKSGLLRETIEAHFWLIENSGRSLDSVFLEMNSSIDRMFETLIHDEEKFNEITGYLFNLLERRSLFVSSEYLALKSLNEVSCTLNNDLAAQLESYRAMKKGNKAPDFSWKDDFLAPGYQNENVPRKLSDIQHDYIVVVFGASWCPACPDELEKMARLYDKWRKYGIEVVFVSLDEDQRAFKNFSDAFPFISICDNKKWDSPIVKGYHVFATPTIYLLNSDQEILLRPNSVNQLSSWVDWFLVQGNK